MKKTIISLFVVTAMLFTACNSETTNTASTSTNTSAEPTVGQSGVKDDISDPNIVQTAAQSKDHTTLVAAVKAAGLVDALTNAGPFTVFAPTNAAFDKLPAGTVDNLLKPENKGQLEDILGYHTFVGVLTNTLLQDGAQYDMVYGGKVKITKEGDKVLVNGTPIEASIKTSNGMIHVINDVLMPQ